MQNRLLTTLVIWMVLAAIPSGAVAASPTAQDKCPVCGMFVSKYPDWLASVSYRDGTTVHFDGPKDLFRYLTNLNRYAPGKQASAVTAVQVRDYYSLKTIDARGAYFVLGSDVFGPMGKELIPFADEHSAREFQRDHRGQRILRYPEITRQTLKGLD